jgi:SAM-dependent methyltransferase
MMFGTRQTFPYFECSSCGCLQIQDFPPDMTPYYPPDYHLGTVQPSFNIKLSAAIKNVLRVYIFLNSLFAKRIVFPLASHSALFRWLEKTRTRFDSLILEVGCGDGQLLKGLKRAGFTNLLGVDPYIRTSTVERHLKIVKSNLENLNQQDHFDFIIFNHSFEHIAAQFAALASVSRLLKKKGFCLMRIPVKTDYIWNRYGVNWYQIDAPRHFFIHTLKSFHLLADKAGLRIKETVFDSDEMMFCASQQYKDDIPLRSESSYFLDRGTSLFTKTQIAQFKRDADDLNKKSDSDQASFLLQLKDANVC